MKQQIKLIKWNAIFSPILISIRIPTPTMLRWDFSILVTTPNTNVWCRWDFLRWDWNILAQQHPSLGFSKLSERISERLLSFDNDTNFEYFEVNETKNIKIYYIKIFVFKFSSCTKYEMSGVKFDWYLMVIVKPISNWMWYT